MLKTLEIYDGEKMVIDTGAKRLYAWYDYHKGYEEWFVIDYAGHEGLVEKFLQEDREEVSLLDLMRAAKIRMAKRYYNSYSEFEITDIVPTEERYDFPSDGSYYAGVKFSLLAKSFFDPTLDEFVNGISLPGMESSKMLIAKAITFSTHNETWLKISIVPDHYSELFKYVEAKQIAVQKEAIQYHEYRIEKSVCHEDDWRQAA